MTLFMGHPGELPIVNNEPRIRAQSHHKERQHVKCWYKDTYLFDLWVLPRGPPKVVSHLGRRGFARK